MVHFEEKAHYDLQDLRQISSHCSTKHLFTPSYPAAYSPQGRRGTALLHLLLYYILPENTSFLCIGTTAKKAGHRASHTGALLRGERDSLAWNAQAVVRLRTART